MPLEQRVVKPICVSRCTLPLDSQDNPISIPNELECVTNGTLANIIRQLSSLARNAEDLFAGILHELTVLIARSTSLQGRIDRLAVKVTQLDSSVEEVSLHDIHLRKPFKSCTSYDQQVVARGTMPQSIKEIYLTCDKPPPLDKLNPYRDDGKDGLKFYTDPKYFFELWRNEMLKETEKEKNNKKGAHRGPGKTGSGQGQGGEKGRQKKPRQPANTRERYRAIVAQQELLEENGTKVVANGPNYVNANGNIIYQNHYSCTLNRPNSLELNQYQIDQNQYHQKGQSSAYNKEQMIPNQPPPAYYGPNSGNNSNNINICQYPNTTSVQSHQIASSYGITSPNYPPVTHTPPPPYNYVSQNQESSSTHMQATVSQSQGTPTRRSGSVIANRPSQPPPAPPSNPPSTSSSSGGTPTVGTPSRSRGQSLTRDSLPPPPPPPPPPPLSITVNGNTRDSIDGDLPLPPSLAGQKMSPVRNYIPSDKHNSSIAPPPPPPPPMPELKQTHSSSEDNNNKNSIMHGPTLAQEILQKQQQLRPAKLSTMNKVLPQHVVQQHSDGRNDLLADIRKGITLRRIEEKQKDMEKSAPPCDVASILARRKALEYSDSESGGANSEGSDSDNWDDESEC